MEASAQDEYVSDFDLEHLEEVVKREMLEQRRNAEAAYALHYQNLQPPVQPQSQPPQQQQSSPTVAQPQQVHVVSHHSAASVAAIQQPAVPLKHQLQVSSAFSQILSVRLVSSPFQGKQRFQISSMEDFLRCYRGVNFHNRILGVVCVAYGLSYK